jgi:uncharacterized phage protein gp47/JayE
MNELINETNITRTSPGAKARTLLKIINKKLNQSYQEFDINFLRAFLPYAQGQFLDYLGDMLGVSRSNASKASASSNDLLVKFYVADGFVFGDINNNLDIFIPSGTLISTGPQNTGIVYRLTTGIYLDRTLSEQYVSVEAVRDGQNSNVGPGVLIHHEFTNYTAAEGLLVTNTGLIENGSKIENDTNYRFRIANQVLASEQANDTAVRLSLLSVPGVADIVLRPYARGIGSYDVVVKAIVPNTPDSVIEACQEALNRTQALGISGLALKPHLTGLSFQISVTWRADVTQQQRDETRVNIQQNLSEYVNNLPIGESFIFNEAIERVMGTSTRILNIGTAQKAFDYIYIYKETKLRDNKVRAELITDYAPSGDERLIIEPTVSIGILVLDKN